MKKRPSSARRPGPAPRKDRKLDKLGWAAGDDDEITSDEGEHISDVDSDGGAKGGAGGSDDGSDAQEEDETAEEKRMRLAKAYISKIKSSLPEGGSDGGAHDAVADRLREEAMAAQGVMYARIASKLQDYSFTEDHVKRYRGHKLAATCVALLEDDSAAFTASKDGSIVRWDVETGKKSFLTTYGGATPSTAAGAEGAKVLPRVKGHAAEVYTMITSADGRYLITGGRDSLVKVWDLRTNSLTRSFAGHRDAVTCLAVHRTSKTLFSGSVDRTIKLWSLDSLAHMDTLFGHTSEVMALDCSPRERLYSCGRDRSVRFWKIAEDSHLILKAQNVSLSMEAVRFVDESWAVAGGQDGSLGMYHNLRKKPVSVVHHAHGKDDKAEAWITSLGVLPNSDLVASGSCDGFVKLWQAAVPQRAGGGGERASLNLLTSVPVPGFVNGLAFSRSGRFIVAATGQEHRLGRWSRVKDARNGLAVVQLPADLMSTK